MLRKNNKDPYSRRQQRKIKKTGISDPYTPGQRFRLRLGKPRFYQVFVFIILVVGLLVFIILGKVIAGDGLSDIYRSLVENDKANSSQDTPSITNPSENPPGTLVQTPEKPNREAILKPVTVKLWPQEPQPIKPPIVEPPEPPPIVEPPEPPEPPPIVEPPEPPPIVEPPEPPPIVEPPEPPPIVEPPEPPPIVEPPEEPISFIPSIEDCEKGLGAGFITDANKRDAQGVFLYTLTVLDRYELGETTTIHMHRCIRDSIQALLEEYNVNKDPSHQLGGWGWRSHQRQIELRRRNCGSTHYDIYQKPPAACSPVTAIPGTSIHQDGLAIDFYCQQHGSIKNNSACGQAFQWLNCNAAQFGLVNLPSEKWHWYYPLHRIELLEAKQENPC